MRGQDILFSKKSNDWETPFSLFDKLNKAYNFDIDVCCTEENKKCKIGITKHDDGLSQNWKTFYTEKIYEDAEKDPSIIFNLSPNLTAWMNPPYSEIKLWLSKAIVMTIDENISTICLLPARTDTKWFHDLLYSNTMESYVSDIRFLKRRLKFVGAKSSAPFPSMLVSICSHSTALDKLLDIHYVDLSMAEEKTL